LLEILLAEEGDRINDLQSWGVSFEKDAKGELALVKGRGHCKSRNVLFDGRDLMQVMKTRLVSQEVSLVQRVMILDLLTSDGSQPTQARVNGALGIDISTGTFKVFSAKAIVVATGVVGAKLHLAYSDNLTGDGQAMALRAGAELGSLELNFCPVFVSPVKPGLAISAGLLAFQTLGARFVNSRGERFLKNYFPDAQEQSLQLGPLGQASAKEILEGRGPLYFDLRHFDDAKVDQIRRILAVKISAFKSSGVDVFRQPVPYVPLLGYFGGGPSGGICVNQWGESTCSGLLAAGICAEFFGCAEFLSGGTLA
jgi:succinate dehydrogenase/fumarate reductase flavoprotein subunit